MKNKFQPHKIKIGKQAKKFLDDLAPAERCKLMNKLIDAVQQGSLIGKSKPVDMEKLKAEEPEIYQQLIEALKEMR